MLSESQQTSWKATRGKTSTTMARQIKCRYIRMADRTANIDTATDRDKWKGLVEAAKGLEKKIKIKIKFECI